MALSINYGAVKPFNSQSSFNGQVKDASQFKEFEN